tara:strand:+ start:203 stop:466 length:264 start_codon:yes stop_codon:yes gene_type:complete
MNNSNYPALLNRRARIFASLNRSDLVVLGLSYLVLTKLGLSGVMILLVSIVILLTHKLLMNRLRRGFFKGVSRTRVVDWTGVIGRSK